MPERRARGADYDRDLQESPFALLMSGGAIPPQGGLGWPSLRRRLSGPERPVRFSGAGTPRRCRRNRLFRPDHAVRAAGRPSYGSGMGYSFATDREGFHRRRFAADRGGIAGGVAGDRERMRSTIASGLLAAYLGAMPGGGCMPVRSSAVRSRASAPCCATPISAALPRSPTRCRAWSWSKCSTRYSRP